MVPKANELTTFEFDTPSNVVVALTYNTPFPKSMIWPLKLTVP